MKIEPGTECQVLLGPLWIDAEITAEMMVLAFVGTDGDPWIVGPAQMLFAAGDLRPARKDPDATRDH